MRSRTSTVAGASEVGAIAKHGATGDKCEFKLSKARSYVAEV